ncbi:MAG: glycoside hydrolase family 43 protein [Microscillaceae bacterium]|nr:glycoside hydrolase family 43 protein [Microscillaceae bacterium]
MKKIKTNQVFLNFTILLYLFFGNSCQNTSTNTDTSNQKDTTQTSDQTTLKDEPLIQEIYTADPSAHVFEGKIYIYPSHDIESDVPEDDLGSHFAMNDYRILSLEEVGGKVTDHGVALSLDQIPWAGRQLWAPDAAFKNGTYYLYFPAKDKKDVFQIGVATSKSPAGPFVPEKEPIAGSYSIDPCVFQDSDSSFYMYFGGIWGGQLQRWNGNRYDANFKAQEPDKDKPALGPRVAKLKDDMLGFAEEIKEIQILDEKGKPFLSGDHERRFFEAAWMHKYKDKYYLSYSTGDTHFIVYATGDSPYGPFTYQGIVLKPVIGWTNHHSIVEYKGKWYLFYHDSTLSKGKTHLRCVKVKELTYNEDGSIVTIDPYPKP